MPLLTIMYWRTDSGSESDSPTTTARVVWRNGGRNDGDSETPPWNGFPKAAAAECHTNSRTRWWLAVDAALVVAGSVLGQRRVGPRYVTDTFLMPPAIEMDYGWLLLHLVDSSAFVGFSLSPGPMAVDAPRRPQLEVVRDALVESRVQDVGCIELDPEQASVPVSDDVCEWTLSRFIREHGQGVGFRVAHVGACTTGGDRRTDYGVTVRRPGGVMSNVGIQIGEVAAIACTNRWSGPGPDLIGLPSELLSSVPWILQSRVVGGATYSDEYDLRLRQGDRAAIWDPYSDLFGWQCDIDR